MFAFHLHANPIYVILATRDIVSGKPVFHIRMRTVFFKASLIKKMLTVCADCHDVIMWLMPYAPPTYKPRRHKAIEIRQLKDVRRYRTRGWGRISKAHLAEYPVCYCDSVKVWTRGEELTVAMKPPGTFRPATITDHIRPVERGGTNDWENLQSICHSCHELKKARYD